MRSEEIPPLFAPYLNTSVPVVSLEHIVLPSGTCGERSFELTPCVDVQTLCQIMLFIILSFPAQRIRVGLKIGHLQSDRLALLFSVMSRFV